MEEKKENREAPKVPEIQFSGDNFEPGKILLPTKVIPLIINKKEVQITLQKIPAGQRREITKNNFKGNIIGQQVQGTMDALGFQIALLSKVIIKAPFEVSENMLSQFPGEVLDYLYDQYQDWTGEDLKKKD